MRITIDDFVFKMFLRLGEVKYIYKEHIQSLIAEVKKMGFFVEDETKIEPKFVDTMNYILKGN